MSFREWLKTKAEDDTPIGDLSSDTFARGEPVWRGKNPRSFLMWLSEHHACDAARSAAWQAIYKWSLETGDREWQIICYSADCGLFRSGAEGNIDEAFEHDLEDRVEVDP